MAINGTRNPHTLAIPLIPKKVTNMTRNATVRPVQCFGIPAKLGPKSPSLSSRVEMALDWTRSPIPKAAKAARTQKATARNLLLTPLSSAYIGPPIIVPLAVFTRYFMARRPSLYFVAMPKSPVSQHHSTAPGPPRETAVATPIMFPVPIVAARDVVNAPNWLTSPSAFLSFLNDMPIALKMYR